MYPVTLLLGDTVAFRDAVPAALLFSINYWPAPPPSLAHLWSVACEMQFYALAPVLYFLGRGRSHVWVALLGLLVGVGVLAPLLDPRGVDKYHFEYAVWPMMLGFCCEHWKPRLAALPGSTFLSWAGVVALIASLALMPLGIQTKQLVIAGGSLSLAPCFFSYLSGRALTGRVGVILTWLGRRTYSIYLWQQPLTICGYLPTILHPLGAVLSTFVGAVSFRWFEQPFLSRSRQLRTRKAEGFAAVAVATLLLATPAVAAPSTGRIVFSREVGGDHELFSMRPDGSGLKRLTNDALHEAEPVWSPDRRRIATAGAADVFIRSSSGRLLRRIPAPASGVITEPRWSPGGGWLAFLVERCQNDGNPDPSPICADLWIVRPAGGAKRRLVQANVSTNNGIAGYAWSPGGRSLVFERFDEPGLAIVDAATGRVRTLSGAKAASDPAWSREGWIAFARQRGAFKGSDLYVVRPDGSGLRRIARARNAMRPVWSPNGRSIAFLDFRPTLARHDWDVTVVGLGGSAPRRVGVATTEWTLAWSPDGARLLWESDPSRLVVGRADGHGRPRLEARGTNADWR
jgi:Tol biopolymer transport system component